MIFLKLAIENKLFRKYLVQSEFARWLPDTIVIFILVPF